MKNIIKSSLTEAEREQLKSLLSQIKAILHGKLAVLTKAERAANKSMMVCVSGCKSRRLVLDL